MTDQGSTWRLGTPRITVCVLGHRMSSWRAWGAIGMVIGSACFLLLTGADAAGLSAALAVMGVDLAGFAALNAISVRLFGSLRMCLLAYLLVALAVSGAVIAMAGAPLADTTDNWLVSVSLFLACGRIGCLLTGCCHGRPAQRGVSYPWHDKTAASSAQPQSRVHPVQAYEALLLAVLAVSGILMHLQQQPPGTFAFTFMAVYGSGRFGLEFLRGDTRRHVGPLSFSQWVCLVLVAGAAVEGLAGVAPPAASQMGIAACLSVLLWAFLGRRHWSGAQANPRAQTGSVVLAASNGDPHSPHSSGHPTRRGSHLPLRSGLWSRIALSALVEQEGTGGASRRKP